STPARHALSLEGAAEVPSRDAVQGLLRGASLSKIKMVRPSIDPDPSTPPASLTRPGGAAAITPADWQVLPSVDRFVLSVLAANTRVLGRAIDEIFRRGASTLNGAWRGLLGHAEAQATPAALARLASFDFLDGRGLLLARASGLRAARRVPDVFDLRAAETV